MAAYVWTSKTLYQKVCIKWIVLYQNKRDLDQRIIVYLVTVTIKDKPCPKSNNNPIKHSNKASKRQSLSRTTRHRRVTGRKVIYIVKLFTTT